MNSPQPNESQQPNSIVEKVDRQQLKQFVTTIRSAEAQVGEHIIGALAHDDTVAVVTTVVMGPDGRQQVVSAALTPDLMNEVQELLVRASQEREEEEPCIGFHCFIKPKAKPDSAN